MKKVLKVIGFIVVLLTILLTIYHYSNNESLPKGELGLKADALANKMLKAINNEAYKNTKFLEWSFRGKHFYKWNKVDHIVEVTWNKTRVILHTKEPHKSEIFIDGVKSENNEILQKAINYFNNDSFWLVAPHKVFEKGIERRVVNYNDKDALLITYTSGGSTPGDSYLWILDDTGLPSNFKMWVSIIPTGGMEASWNNWVTTESGTLLPESHQLSIGTLEMGDVKGYN